MNRNGGSKYPYGYGSGQHLARLVALISKLQRDPNQPRSAQNNQDANEGALARYTRNLVIVTSVIAIVGVLNFGAVLLQWDTMRHTDDATHDLASAAKTQAEALGQQAAIMQGQLKAMEADQRPWIKIEATIAGPLTFFEPVGFADMPMHFMLTNVGHSPAFNVRLTAWSFLLSLNHHELEREWGERCENFKRTPLDNPARGMILFPCDQLPWDQSGIGLTPDDIKKNIIDEGGNKGLDVWIYGCADYVFGEPKAHHQTGFVYRLGHLIPSKGVMALSFRFRAAWNIPGRKHDPHIEPKREWAN
jgi:hypothetical protein